MKVIIFEISSKNHSVMIYNWVKICKENHWDYLIVSTDDIFNQISDLLSIPEKNVHLFKRVTLVEVIKVILKLNKNDRLIITSLQNNFLYYLPFLLLKVDIYITLHNINTWLNSPWLASVKGVVKKIVRKLYLYRAKKIIVNSRNMKLYAISFGYNSSDFLIVPFSMRHVCEKKFKREVSKINVVYPGMVSVERKDYKLFFKLALKYPDINFILLGKLNLNEGAGEVKEFVYQNKLNNIKFFDNYVDKTTFDQQMLNADIIFGNVNVEYKLQGVMEKYGVSKDSGLSYLMIEFALPLIINSSFNNFHDLSDLTMYYDADTIDKVFYELICNYELRKEVRNNILLRRKLYSVKHVSRKVEEDFMGN